MGTTKATFKKAAGKAPAASKSTPAAELAALGGAPRSRKTVPEPEQVPGAIRMAPVSGTQRPVRADVPDPATESQVEVDVPREFMLQGDDRIMYRYKPGRQEMPKSHAEHSYAVANGVTPAPKKAAK